jgi:tRNA (cmo5U34)-methyltransferase
MATSDFSFAAHAEHFESHISSSIPAYGALSQLCIDISRRFIQPQTKVLDIGCSTGTLLRRIHLINSTSRRGVLYCGLDIEPRFAVHWHTEKQRDLRFEVGDVLSYQSLREVSLAISLFTIQFIRPQDKLSALRSIYAGLVEGGALLIAEKTFASTSRLQDALTFPYYDHKIRQKFSARSILDKERSLRGQMTLWTAGELIANLQKVGFNEIQPIWAYFPFQAFLAIK